MDDLLQTTLDDIELDSSMEESEEDNSSKVDFNDAVVWGTDWTIETIAGQIEKNNIDLKPAFQRRDAWTDKEKSMLGILVPPIILAEKKGERNNLFEEKVSFIIEEPESHLFPATQKLLMEYISLIFHQDDQVFITTHSPYILGTINNMLYAGNLSKRFVNRKNEIDDIIPSDYQLNIDNVSAWFVEAGRLTDIMDHDINEIDHDKVDEKR